MTEGGPAADAGLRAGDVIVSVGGREVDGGGELQEIVATRAQGEEVRLTFYRDGERRTADVRLGAAPGGREVAAASAPREGAGVAVESARLGLALAHLDAATAERFGWADAGGVVIRDVEPLGPAARRGVTPGSRLVRIGERAVGSVEQAGDLLEDVESGEVVTLVLEAPGGQRRIVNVRAR